MILVDAVASVLQRKANLAGARCSECRISKGMVVVPDLDLLFELEVVTDVKVHHLDVRLGKVAVRAGAPGEPEIVVRACCAQHRGAGSAAEFRHPVIRARPRRNRRIAHVGPTEYGDVGPGVGRGAFWPGEYAHLA